MRTNRRRSVLWLLVALLAALPSTVWADITLTLTKGFIQRFKNRAAIEATYSIGQAHKTPNPVAKDADRHVAGRAPEIGLATVAAIMNAADQPKGLALVKQSVGGERWRGPGGSGASAEAT